MATNYGEDPKAHWEFWSRFTDFTTYGTIAVAVLLVALFLFLVIPSWG